MKKYVHVHRLVALAFIPNPLNKATVNHIDEVTNAVSVHVRRGDYLGEKWKGTFISLSLDYYYEAVANYKNGHASIGSMFEQIDSKCSREKLSYKYIEIGDVNVGTGVASFNVIETNELPDNAKIMTKKDDILISKVRPNRGAIAILEDDDFLVSGAFTVLREKNKYKKEVLHVILRSEIYRDWLLRYNVGTSYPVIKDEDVLNMPLPLLDEATQNEIAAQVQESFKLRNESEKLINTAVRAVEIAIEQSEDKAMEFINNYKNF